MLFSALFCPVFVKHVRPAMLSRPVLLIRFNKNVFSPAFLSQVLHRVPEVPRSKDTMSNNSTVHNCTIEQKNYVFVAVYSLVFLTSLVLNLTALVIFFCSAKSRSHTTVYMTNLALADLLLVLTLPMRICYHLGYDLPSFRLCEIIGLVLLVNMYGSIFLLTCMSFDRCMAVCFPMSPRVKEARKKAPFVCLGVWMLTIGASLPIYLPKMIKNQEPNSICFGSSPIYATQPGAVAATLTVGFTIPLTTMLVCSWFMIRAIDRSTVAQMKMINSQKIQRMVTANLTVFLVCFLPYHLLLGLLSKYSNPTLCTAFHHSFLVACLNASLDPIVYYFTTETFQDKVDIENVWRMLPKHNHSSDKNQQSEVPLNT
ncbi:lysophosphatidic acid receptor 6 isoform X1 [Paramormyrops kingsleyae]|uniref:lysophosphatidic acid receptor 6 isoform X1 n=2 Tax=Paramormyrops kingsleyae TaxID=1676925 RepID=UPI003B974F3C